MVLGQFGLKVNLDKSELVPVGKVSNVEDLSDILGHRVSKLPMTYLGLPLGSIFKEKDVLNAVIEKMERQLAGLKKCISLRWKNMIIKSTLSNLPTYYLSLFSIPMGVAWHIEKLQRDFQWHGIEDEFKFYLVNWRIVCASLSSNGLSIRNLDQFNHALLGKWFWGYTTEREASWLQMVENKYGSMWGDGALNSSGVVWVSL